MVAVDTSVDEDMLQEYRASTLTSIVQKLRKSAGLVVGDVVEVFYEEKGDTLASAVCSKAVTTVQKLKSLPLPVSMKPQNAVVITQEKVSDTDLSKSPVVVYLTRPTISMNRDVVEKMTNSETADLIASYLQSMDYARAVTLPSIRVIKTL